MKIAPHKAFNRKKKSTTPLTQKEIVQASLILLDEVGFDGITMRALAAKLGVKAASLYWHVRNKQELFTLLADEICAPIREPDISISWQEQLEFLGNEYRNTLLLHRDAAKVLASSNNMPSGSNRLRLTEIILTTLLNAGFNKQDAVYAGFLLNEYVTMFVLGETQYENIDDDNSEESPLDFQGWVNSLPQNKYPGIRSLADYLQKPDAGERFRFGMEILKSGLASYLTRKNK